MSGDAPARGARFRPMTERVPGSRRSAAWAAGAGVQSALPHSQAKFAARTAQPEGPLGALAAAKIRFQRR